MLRSILICPDEEFGAGLERALFDTRLVGVVRESRYPAPIEVRSLLQLHDPQVLFLSTRSAECFLSLAECLDQEAPEVPLVAVGDRPDANLLQMALRAGARELLTPPFDTQSLRPALLRLSKLWERMAPATKVSSRIYAFLPAKAGAGASTVALHTSLALARNRDLSVLLADFDLDSGILGFMLRLNSQHSVIDALERASELDDALWTRLVSSSGRLDVLPAGRLEPTLRIDTAALRALVTFIRRNYHAFFADLSGMMEKFSLELLQEARRIFVVCTPETPSLHLAGQKLRYLASLDLDSRVEVILNRTHRHAVVSQEEIERLVGAPVRFTIPNDYARVHDALIAGKVVDPGSRLGQRFQELALTLLEDWPRSNGALGQA